MAALSSPPSSSDPCATPSTNFSRSFPPQHQEEEEDDTSLSDEDPLHLRSDGYGSDPHRHYAPFSDSISDALTSSTAHLLPLRNNPDERNDLRPPPLPPLFHITFDQDHRCSSTSGMNHRLVTCDDHNITNAIPVRKSNGFESGMNDHGDSSSLHSDLIGSSSSTPLQNPNSDYSIVDHRALSQSSAPSLLHVAFNQDYGCFAAGMGHGFRIHNCDPFREIFRRDFDSGGGIGVVEMLFRCNILALVGGGPDPQYPPNKVMIWDDHESRCIGELSFRSEVRAVRLRRYRIVVVLEQKILVHNFSDLKLLHQIETISNRKGLCAISQLADSMVLVCPGLQKGQVRVEHYASKRTRFIMAHDSRIACFSLTQDGKVLATASSKGTLVRVFNTLDGSLLQELRRGADRAEIYSLAFSSNAQWLVVSSDKGTIHVFSLKNFASTNTGSPRIASHGNTPVTNAGSLSFIKGVLPKYFRSEWSVAQFRVLEGPQYIAGFGPEENTVVIVGADGSFYKCGFDPINGGEMSQLVYHNFLKPEDAF